jgi:putative transcriptional regulator
LFARLPSFEAFLGVFPFHFGRMIASVRTILIVATVALWGGPASAAEMNAVFLIASPGLQDPNFRETVVLVTHSREGGPWGVIINRPLDYRLSEVFTEYETLKNRKDVIHFGGPVARDGLVFLVRSLKPPPRAVPVLRDVYFISDIDWIDGLLQRPEPTRGLRVYSGYSGWAPGQLQSEIARGGWHILPADAETVFDKDPAHIWPELIQRAATRQTRKDEGGRMKDDQVLNSALRGSSLIPHPSSFGTSITHHVSWTGRAHP